MSGSSIYRNIDQAITKGDGTQKDFLPCNMCPYLGLCSSVCYCPSFSCTLYNLQISRPSSYNTKLHSCSPNTLNKGFPFTPFNHVI